MKKLVLLNAFFVCSGFAFAGIRDNHGPRIVQPELSDAAREKQMSNLPRMDVLGGVVQNDRKPVSNPGITRDSVGDSAITATANDKREPIDGRQALAVANQDVTRAANYRWWKVPLIGGIFSILGLGVLVWFRSWADKNVPPPPAKKRRKM